MSRLRACMLRVVVFAVVAVASSGSASAEDFALGAVGGYGFSRGLSAELPNGQSARAGVGNGAAAGFFFRDEMYANLSGEFRYLYRWGAHKVSNDSASARLGAHSHLFHYDLLFHTRPATARYRTFFAIGAGGRVYQGSGTPARTQPLSNLVLLRKASETRPMLSLGGGVRWAWRGNSVLQFDVRDYVTPAPRKVFAPGATSTVDGWIHDVIPQLSIAVRF